MLAGATASGQDDYLLYLVNAHINNMFIPGTILFYKSTAYREGNVSSETSLRALSAVIVATETDNELLHRTGDLNAPGDDGRS